MSIQSAPQKEFYDRLLTWVLQLSEQAPLGFLIGLNGPQGAGKSTLCAALCDQLTQKGKRAIAISIDDFYLTHAEQKHLAARRPANPYLQQRGYPGTHDIELGLSILSALKSPYPGEIALPRYDKSAFGGEGDRLAQHHWTRLALPVDIILLEGWMLGFPPRTATEIADESLREVNELLRGYQPWLEKIDAFVQLDPEDYRFVLEWRVEAEQKMRAQGRGAMSDEAIQAYVRNFLPAYELYLPALRENLPIQKNVLRVRIGRNRLPRL